MALLHFILLFMQLAIFYRLATSTLWKSDRLSTECIKVIYATVGLATALTTVIILASMFKGAADVVPLSVRMGVLTLLTLHSLTSYHIVYIFNNRRLTRITKRRNQDAAYRPHLS